MSRTSIVLALCTSLGPISTAFAVDPAATDLQAQLSWRAAFGGASRHVEAGYGLTVGYRAALDAPTAQVLQLDVSDRAAFARLLGTPLATRSFRLDDAGTDTQPSAETPPVEETPWYSHSWVLWTAGGVAAALAVAAGGGADDTVAGSSGGGGQNINVLSPDPDQTCATKGVPPFPDTCVDDPVPLPLLRATHDPGFATNPTSEWLDADTGRMGDLIAR